MKQVYPTTIQSGLSQSGSYLLMLHEPISNTQVPIVIGQYEAQSILIAKNAVPARRPLTHHLLTTILDTYGLSLTEVTIDRVLDGIFYSTLHLTDGFNPKTFDSRTTDAITLALLCNAPIMMDENVLNETAVQMPQPDGENSTPSTLEELETELRRCEEAEEYERAAEIQQQIDKLKGQL